MKPVIRPDEVAKARDERDDHWLDIVAERLNGEIVRRHKDGRRLRCSCRVPRHLRGPLADSLAGYGWSVEYPLLRNFLLDTIILEPLKQ